MVTANKVRIRKAQRPKKTKPKISMGMFMTQYIRPSGQPVKELMMMPMPLNPPATI